MPSSEVNTTASKEGNLSKDNDRYLSDDGNTNLADDGGEIESEGKGEGEGEQGEGTNNDVLTEWMTWLLSTQGDESEPRASTKSEDQGD